MPRIAPSRRAALLIMAALAIPAVGLSSTAAAGQAARAPLPSPTPSYLAGPTTPLDPATTVNLRVYLASQPGLADAALNVSNPHSPEYARYLTPAQAQQRFGATPTQAQTVNHWLTSAGMTVTATTPHFLAVTATVAQADAAFDTQIVQYSKTTDGSAIAAAGVDGGFTVPSALSTDITSVTGIESIPLTQPSGGKTPPKTTPPHQPTPQSATRQPTPQSATRQPTPQSVTRQPTPQSVTRQPTPQPVTRQPTPQPVTHQPTPQSAARQPTARSAELPSPAQTSPQSTARATTQPTAATTAQAAPQQASAQTTATTASQVPDGQCSQYWAQHTVQVPAVFGQTTVPTSLCGYTPDQIRAAYGISGSPYTGKGATVAVILDGSVPTEQANANQLFTDHGDAGFAPGQFTEDIDPGTAQTCTGDNPPGDPEEESIDVQSVHIAAPDAHVLYVGGNCSYDVGTELGNWLDSVTKIVDGHLADVASGSFGFSESGVSRADTAAWDPVLQQGALEGIGFNFSSGDSGDINGSGETQFPATDPWVTAVGGTSLAIGANGNVVADFPWGDSLTQPNAAGTGYDPAPPGTYYGGSGGGPSALYAQPAFQRGVVHSAARTIPDISADAGLSWLIGFTGAVTDGQFGEAAEGGGTSASSPLIAGLEADAKQATGHALGFADPALYQLCGTAAIRDILPVDPAHPPVFYGSEFNIADNTLFTMGEDSSLKATLGYDDVTGLGAPTASFVSSFTRL